MGESLPDGYLSSISTRRSCRNTHKTILDQLQLLGAKRGVTTHSIHWRELLPTSAQPSLVSFVHVNACCALSIACSLHICRTYFWHLFPSLGDAAGSLKGETHHPPTLHRGWKGLTMHSYINSERDLCATLKTQVSSVSGKKKASCNLMSSEQEVGARFFVGYVVTSTSDAPPAKRILRAPTGQKERCFPMTIIRRM